MFTLKQFIELNADLRLNHKTATKLLRERGYIPGWARVKENGDWQSVRYWGKPEEFGRPTKDTPIKIPD